MRQMYKIIVCFKITDDYDELSCSDWKKTDDSGYPVTDFVRRMIGCFDEAALENGLLLKEQLQKQQIETQIVGVTVNPGYSEHILKRLAAVGIDRIVCLDTEEPLDFYPKQTAGVLADFIRREGGADLILTGLQSAPGNTGCVPHFLADTLEMPVRNGVVRFETDAQGISAVCERPDAYAGYRIEHPAVCVMGNTEKSFLRIPTLREKMRVKNDRSEHISAVPYGKRVKPEFSAVNQERHCQFIEMQGVKEMIKTMHMEDE